MDARFAIQYRQADNAASPAVRKGRTNPLMNMSIDTVVKLLPPAALLLHLFATPGTLLAQERDGGDIHWAYANYFGSGWYSIGDDQDVFALRLTKRWTFSDASLDDSGERRIGVKARLPILLGVDRFELDDPLGAVDFDNVSFLSVNPTVALEIPVNERWTLKPMASAGYGQALDGSDSAWSYSAVVRSRLSFAAGNLDWHIINAAGFVGFTPDSGPSDNMWPLMAGLAFSYPVGDRDLRLHWHLAYTKFGNDLDFQLASSSGQPVEDEWEAGFAFGRPGKPVARWWRFEFQRLGLGYRRSSDGDLEGITLIFRSLFDE